MRDEHLSFQNPEKDLPVLEWSRGFLSGLVGQMVYFAYLNNKPAVVVSLALSAVVPPFLVCVWCDAGDFSFSSQGFSVTQGYLLCVVPQVETDLGFGVISLPLPPRPRAIFIR